MIVRRPWQPPVPPEIRDLFRAENLTLVGVCDFARDPDAEDTFARWIADGRNGTMDWLAHHVHAKYNPEAFFSGGRSILFAGLNYYQRYEAPRDAAARGRFARYAWGRDYHKELGNRMRRIARRLAERFPADRFRPFTDATPLGERFYGERAGIGFTGRNSLLINGELGSWFVIGEVLSTRHFEPSPPAAGRHGGCPLGCVKCIDACPTDALLGDGRIDAARCISYLTIEHEGAIPEQLRPLIGAWLFGCDVCQEVCPLNVRARETGVAAFRTPIAGPDVPLQRVIGLSNREEFLAMFAGSPVVRAGRRRIIRNACVVAGNSGDGSLLPILRRRAAGDDGLIAEHARWAITRIESGHEIAKPRGTE